jgi:hypothetical protein
MFSFAAHEAAVHFKKSAIYYNRERQVNCGMQTRLGLFLSDSSDGALVQRVDDFVVMEGPSICKDDTILKINGFSAKNHWRDLLKGGTPNSPFRLQFLSGATGEVHSCVIYKQLIDTVPVSAASQTVTGSTVRP